MIDKVIVLSRKINKISEGAENLYYRIYVNTDDYGHYHADPDIIKGQIYTLRNISLTEIQARISELAKIGLIKLYNHNTEEYLEIVDFEKHQTFRKDIIRQKIYPTPVTYLKRDVTDAYENVTDNEDSLNPGQQEITEESVTDAERDVTDAGQHVTKRCSKLSKVKLSKVKLREEKIREYITLTSNEHQKLKNKFPEDRLQWMFDKLDFWATKKKKIINGYGYFKKGSWLLEEMEKHFQTAVLEPGIEYDDKAVLEAREELAKLTPEQYEKNRAKIRELVKGVTKDING